MTSDFLLTTIGLIGMQVFLSWGSIYTIMSHANLFSSICAIVIVTYRLLTFQRVTIPEIVGSFIAIGGCVITSYDSGAQKVDSDIQNIDLGNFLSSMSALFATLYIIKGQEVSKKIDPLHYLCILTFLVTISFMIFGPIFFTNDFHFNMDYNNGLFGWLHAENILYCLLVLSLLNGCGTLGL